MLTTKIGLNIGYNSIQLGSCRRHFRNFYYGNASWCSHSGSMEVPQKTKNKTTLRLSNCTTRHLSTGYKGAVLKGHMHPHVYSSTIDSSQSMERAQMSIDGWMDKEDVVYIYTMDYYSAIKKNEILPFATTWMKLEGIMLSEISRSEKDKYHMTSLIWGL